jgi:hypothetical protein
VTTFYERTRRSANDDTKSQAINDGESWATWEQELLLEWSHDEDELTLLATMLGRTREACRIKYYDVRRRGMTDCRRSSPRAVRVVRRRSGTVATYLYDNWPADERSEWYG